MASWTEFFTGTPAKVEQISRFTPEQSNALKLLLQMGSQGLQNVPASQDIYQGFEPIAQRARSQFAQSTIPSLAERFTAMGAGSLSSPAFASQLGQAGAGLEEGLAALQSQYGMQNRMQNFNEQNAQRQYLMQLLGLGLQPQFDQLQVPGQPGFLQNILPALGRAGAHTGAALLSGGFSAIPSALSNLLGSM